MWIAALALLLQATPGFALPTLDCTGTIPSYVEHHGEYKQLNAAGESFSVSARDFAVLLIGPNPKRPWLTTELSRPLKWRTFPELFQKSIRLGVRSDRTSYFNVQLEGIYSKLSEHLNCRVDDDIRKAGAL